MLSLLHREGGASTLMETELQDLRLAVYPRMKVLFQPTDRTHPHMQLKLEVLYLKSQGLAGDHIQRLCAISKATY